MIIALYVFISGREGPSPYLHVLFFKMILATLGPSLFHLHFRVLLNSLEGPIQNLIGTALTSRINSGGMAMFMTLSLSAHEHAMHLYLLASLGLCSNVSSSSRRGLAHHSLLISIPDGFCCYYKPCLLLWCCLIGYCWAWDIIGLLHRSCVWAFITYKACRSSWIFCVHRHAISRAAVFRCFLAYYCAFLSFSGLAELTRLSGITLARGVLAGRPLFYSWILMVTLLMFPHEEW